MTTTASRTTSWHAGTGETISVETLQRIDSWWRAANYLSVAQIYLLDNPLLREPLIRDNVKPRLLGHWGTTPGLNFLYAHLNRMISERQQSTIYITGPGHGGPGMVANAYLDGTYSEVYSDITQDDEGLRRLVDTFRTLGQLPKVEKAPIDLAELVEELKLDPMFAAKLVVHPPDAPVVVRADKLLLKRVLANLVENGIHAGQEAGKDGLVEVAWGVDARGESVLITVDDRGKGVSEDNRDKIFEPYVTTKATGTGLGLAIARKIAIEHGGELAVAPNRAPTGGARFEISLPLRGPDASLG